MFLVMASALCGAIITAVVFWENAWLALLGAPFGGSLVALIAAASIAWRNRGHELTHVGPDELVSELRDAAEQGRERKQLPLPRTDAPNESAA